MKLYWLGLGSFAKILHLVVAIALAVLLFLLIAGGPAQADGYGPSQAGYKDDFREERYRPVAYRRGDVRDYLTASEKRELRRLHAKAVARRDGRRVAARYDEPLPVRYVERRNAPESLYTRAKACKPKIERAGTERNLRWRAEESAMKAWRREAIDQHGYQFAGYTNAIGLRTTCSNIKGYVYICRTAGRPCKDL